MLALKPHSRRVSRRSVTTAPDEGPEGELDNLASSQPIPLFDLCNRASSRNRPSRSRRSHRIHHSPSENTEDIASNIRLPEGSQYKHEYRSRASHQHHPGGDQGMLEGYQGESTHLHTPEATGLGHGSDLHRHEWTGDGSIRHNPLSSSDGYNYYWSLPQRHDYVSESSFAQNYDYLRSADMHPAPFGKSTMQSEIYGQDYLHEADYVPEAPFPYQEGFEPSYSLSTYESLPQYPHPQARLELPPPTFDLQHAPENKMHAQYAPIRTYKTRSSAHKVVLSSNTGASTTARPSRTPRKKAVSDNEAAKLYLEKRNKLISDPERKISVQNKRYDRKEEFEAFLDDVLQRSKLSDKRTMKNVTPTKEPQTQESDSIPRSQRKLEEHTQCLEMEPPATHVERSESEPKAKLDYSEKHTRNLSSATRKILRPRPGLPHPAANALLPEPSPSEIYSIAQHARLEKANNWFRKDGRKKQPICRKVLETSRDYIEKCEKNSKQDKTVAKETILLLGSVITNLYSYVSDYNKKHPDYFSTFREVNPRYCDTSNAERRSYFETDLFTTSRELPPRRANSRQSHDKPEKKLVLI